MLRVHIYSTITSPPDELILEMRPSDTILDLKTKIFHTTGAFIDKLKVQQIGTSAEAEDGRTLWYYEFNTLPRNAFVDVVRSDIEPIRVRSGTC